MSTNYDPKYTFVTCACCGQHWQRIDFGCSAHVYFCANPSTTETPTQSMTFAQWEAHDRALGLVAA